MAFRKLNEEGRVSVNGERLNRLRFADDIVLIVNSAHGVNEMLQGLNARSKGVG